MPKTLTDDSGGITPIQVVGSSTDTLCLSTASSNASTNLFSMDLAGLPAPSECDTSLKIKHDGSAASAPYNYTIVPLDGGYKPWSAAFPDGVNELDVSVNMTSGSRFSVFLRYAFLVLVREVGVVRRTPSRG
jgi:hypothetical protein